MVIRAVAFDLGGVLEHLAAPDRWLGRWQERLGMGTADFDAAISGVDPDGLIRTGGMGEPEYRLRYATALGLSRVQADEFMADMWDWYCGELDDELAGYAKSLRPQYATAIMSNSADGARREEQARYGFAEFFDPIIYSHEVGFAKPDPRIYALLCQQLDVAPPELIFLDDVKENVAAANSFGIHGVLHRDTRPSIDAINTLIAGGPPSDRRLTAE